MQKTKQDDRLTRSTNDRMIAGVCAGLANYLNVDPFLVRLIFGVLLLGGEGILIYLVLWLVMPEDTEPVDDNAPAQLRRPQQGRQIAGVCAALADYFRFDVNLVRLVFLVAALSGGTGVLLYIMLAIIIPEETANGEKPKRGLI
jgi:phage shock protein PspC (stress-responsive transcriptional regulator)